MASDAFSFFVGIILYLVIRHCRAPWWITLFTGLVISAVAVISQRYYSHINFSEFIHQGVHLNFLWWKILFVRGVAQASEFMIHNMLNYLIGFPLLIAGLLDLMNLIAENPHQQIMKALKKGVKAGEKKEISKKEIEKALKNIREEDHDGTVLGVSHYTGKCVVVPDKNINQVMLVLGTTGSGKTITLRRFYKRAITQGYPLVIVDGKPDEENIAWLKDLSEKYNRKFIGFNCGNYLPYDPLANGGYTELKDKIISLKDEWSSDYYRSIAEDYLQTTLEALIKSKKTFDLRAVVNCLNYKELTLLARDIADPVLTNRVKSLEHYDRKDITGLQAHLNILIHSELGDFFERNDSTFTLPQAIKENAVVYFALPALRFPSFSKVLGKLVINDLKAVIDRNNTNNRPIFTVFDEFSVFAGEQVLNLVNMGRGKGVHAIFGTQGLADLEKVDETFKKQVLNCINTLICHRLNDSESAEWVAKWVGTQDVFNVTAQLNLQEASDMGSVKFDKEFIIHPETIKQKLKTGEAFYVSKVNDFLGDKVKIKFI